MQSEHNRPRWDPRVELGLPEPLGAVIDGEWSGTDAAETLCVRDPADLREIAVVAEGDADQVDGAVRSAEKAYRGAWRAADATTRGRILTALADTIRSHAETLARLETVDTGKPLSQARSDVETSARYFEYYAGVADKILGDTLPQPAGSFAYTVREPYGVVAHVTPWNSPLSQMCRGLAPSLAAGNTVVVKPSEVTPLSSLVAARLFAAAGLPLGVCNVVPGRGPTTGAALVAHPLVRHVSFTGSVATGREILRSAAAGIVPCNLELGGKSPTLVFPDADLDAAARAGAMAVVRNSGQSCFATTRLIVHRSIHDAFVERVRAHVGRLSVGHGLDDPDLGPLASAEQLDKVVGYLDAAREEGARVAIGGSRPGGAPAGYFLEPTVLVDVANGMRVAREEIFGPVQSVLSFDTEDEAVAMANDSDYGLAAGVFTGSLSVAHRVAARLEAGQVQVNKYPAGGVDTPFGGYKKSGIGREKGLEALLHYTQLKTVIIELS
ncbi:MAG: aldehyde dehydrogenase family protein [Streptosporangiales bacterium]|nr:aldehyde dehydrogenase family protein [Streptosporangiales bacterium]